MQLVIVESFAKAKTIQKYLNKGTDKNFKVVASGGHLFDLSNTGKTYGLQDTKKFEPIYELIAEKGATFKKLKQEVKEAKIVWLAADNDREGEAIAWHLERTLPANTYRRIVFNEITPTAIQKALAAPRQIDKRMVEAQQTRRVLDRVIGYCLSNVLNKGFSASGRTLSAGRVQSVVLKLIVQKEQEVREHKSVRYWTVGANFTDSVTDAVLYKDDTVYKFAEQAPLLKFFEILKGNDSYDVETGTPSKVREAPDAPFTTSTLQQRATSLGFSIQRTMGLAQGLYEQGHITYMRTDSTTLSEDAKQIIRQYVSTTYGREYLNQSGGASKKQAKHVQGAHEAIRPTRPDTRKPSIKDADALKLYQLIFDHTTASQMAPAEYCELKVRVRNKALPKEMVFVTKMKALHFPGWRAAFGTKTDKEGLKHIQAFVSKTDLKTVRCLNMRANCVWSVPPARYSEATMIKKMEKEGIGRPSTYVSMVQKLYERHYIQKTDVKGETKVYTHFLFTPKAGAKEEIDKRAYYTESGRLVPYSSGCQVSEFMVKWFPKLVNIEFTSGMETKLDEIAENRTNYLNVMRAFFPDFDEQCKGVISKVSRRELDDSSRRVLKHGRIVRMGKYGPLVEIPISEGKSKFVGLAPYMKLAKKQMEQITDADLDLLLKMPLKVGRFKVQYGRYGFYVSEDAAKRTSDCNTLTIYAKHLESMHKNEWTFLEKMFEEAKCTQKPSKNKKNV